jgi:hypothetical protein
VKEPRASTPILKVVTSGVRSVFYTCPPNCRAKVPLIYIVNANGTVSVTLEIYKALGSTHFFIQAGKNLASGESVQLSDGYIVLEPGDKLELTCTGATVNVDVLCTVEETFITGG